ncbi:MAG: N-acetyltransferase [Hyphomicrobiaceae bacterium]|nr:N-acetyltransferase [Hyphomicrobiaceae bacterium]
MTRALAPNLAIRAVEPSDLPAISALHKAAFGPGRFARTAYRVREGTAETTPHCRAAFLGDRLVAALRMTEVTVAGRPGALLLGPVAVAPDLKGNGYGRALIKSAIDAARGAGKSLVVLVGDVSYYGRFGFASALPNRLSLPGPVDPARILVLELQPESLAGFAGPITASPS